MRKIKRKLKKIREEEKKLRMEIKERTIGYMLAAFGLVAGLAWNEAIKTFIEHYFPIKGSGVLAKFIYALLITIIIVVISVYLMRLIKKEKAEKE